MKLKTLQGRVKNLKDEGIKKQAKSRLNDLDGEMFESWFLELVDELKQSRLYLAHPELGSYQEMEAVIKDQCENEEEREDKLKALKHLKTMCEKLNRPFGK